LIVREANEDGDGCPNVIQLFDFNQSYHHYRRGGREYLNENDRYTGGNKVENGEEEGESVGGEGNRLENNEETERKDERSGQMQE
jgi:hypothetical protein